MGENQRLGLVVLAVVLCTQLQLGTGSTFDFLYNEDGDEGSVNVVDEEVILNGSYASLGQWPHWCLGNIFICSGGISLNVWVKFTNVAEDTSGIYVFSSGGHTWYSNGLYFKQRLGNEYEVGVALSEALWIVNFRIIPEMWTNIYVTFDTVSGLNVMVDGSMHENPDPGDRFYGPMEFESFQDVAVGLNLDGSPHRENVRYEISKLQVFDWQSSIARPAYNDIGEDLLWLRCGQFNPESTSPVMDIGTALMDCRYFCSSSGKTVAALYMTETCACADLEDIDSMTSDVTSCVDDDWRFYTASALQQTESYTMSVSVTRLGTREYTKPLESVKINIIQNFIVNVPFTVDFGDGTIMEIEGNEISYFWLTEGTYDIDVFANIGTAQLSASVEFKVENIDENNAGDYVMLEAYHGKKSNVANIDFTSIDHSMALCNLQFGEVPDFVDVEIRNLTDYVMNKLTTHNYSMFGHYDLVVDCMNAYGTIHNRTTFTAQKLETTFHLHTIGTPFVTEMAGDATFFDRLIVEHNDPDLSVALSHNNSRMIIRPEYLKIHENFLSYNYGETPVDKRIISVQNIVQKPAVTSNLIDGAWNLTTNITVGVPSGNNMYLNVSFSYGEDQLFYIHYLPAASNIVFEIMFQSLGYYPVFATVSNDISNSTHDLLVSVEVPIITIALQVSDIVDKASPIQLLINLNDGEQGPMKTNFDVDFGNGDVKSYFTHSESFFFKTYEVNYYYPDWGNYDICVRAFNRITSVTDCTSVQIGQKITYIDIQLPSSGRFYVNETARALLRSPKGSDRGYMVDFGDGEIFVFTDQYLKDTEHFDPTTTTTTISTTVAPTTTGTVSTTTQSVNGTNATTGSESSFDNTTITVNETSGGKTNGSQESFNVRRRRDVNGTGEATAWNSTFADNSSESFNMSFVNTTMSTMTFTTSVFLNATTNETDTSNSSMLNTTTPPATTTTHAPTTTTTVFIPATMAPIPDNHSTPISTNETAARRLRDGRIELTHIYRQPGTFRIRVNVFNAFNFASDTLCPLVIVDTVKNTKCERPVLTVPTNLQSSKNNPIQFFRSDQVNLTAEVAMTGCGDSVPTLSWRTIKYVEEEGRIIEKQYHGDRGGICLLEDTEKIFRYARSSLPFGKYRVRLVVSAAGSPNKETIHDFYMQINPSAPHAVIDGNDEHRWFLVYATAMIKFAKSVDPDFGSTDGIEYDLVCMAESKLVELKKNGTRDNLIKHSTLVTESVTFKYTAKNQVRLYEHSPCFAENANITRDIRFPKGEFNIPAEYFVSNVPSFAIRLFVTKNNMTTSADVTFEIRLSNSSNLLDQLDDLLASKDTTGVMRAVEALSASLLPPPSNGTDEDEDFELQEQVTDLKTKLIGALDSVSEGVKDIGQASGMLGLVDDLTKDSNSVSESARVGATSAIKNSATVTEEFADEPLDALTGVGSSVVSGVSNVLPKEDPTLKKLAEHEKSIAAAEQDKKAAIGPSLEELEGEEGEAGSDSETDGADITLDDPEELTQLTEEDILSNAPLPYNKLLKKCDLLHGRQLDKLYKYIFFYEPIFRHVIKNFSVEIMISAEILKLKRNDIFCYIGILEEPADVEWYVNRLCDDEKRRRDLIRKNADRSVSQSFMGAMDSVSSVLINKTEANQTVEMNAKGLKVAMKKSSGNSSDGSDSMVSGGAGIKMPALNMDEAGNGTEVGQTLIINDQSPFTYANENDTTEVGTSVVTFKLSTPGTKDEVKVSNSTEPIEIYLAGNPEKVQFPMLNTLLMKPGDTGSSMNYHSINVTKNDTTLHILVRPQFSESTDLFDVLLQYEGYPNDTHHIARAVLPLPEESIAPNLTWEHTDALRHTFYPDANLTKLAGIYKVGVRLRSGNIDFNQEVTVFNYTWQMFLGGCRFWNDVNETWDSDGCVVGNLTTSNSTQCLCTHLTSFGGEMVVPPNTIDFNNVWAKFNNLNENAAVFSTVVALLGVYVIGLIWARYMDKKDIIKWGASPLEDNLPTDNYHYQVSVYTGLKKLAGTKSNVSFIISGETHDTGVRRLFDGKRKSHGRGSIMNYILSVENKLGPLSFCRIWHDNSGEGKDRSWFLDQLEVTDLQSGERYYFLCNRWLAVEEDDGMVDRVLPVAGIEDLVAFKQLFSSSIRKKLTSDHLWLSVFTRPTRSKFTRVQRISCCVSLLFLTMITNAMWFKGPSEGETNSNKQVVSLKIGPISFTLQQVFISLASTIIVFPPSFLLITLFRRTKQKRNTVMQTNQRLPKRGKWKNLGAGTQSRSNMWDDEPKTTRFQKFKASVQALVRGKGNSSKYDTATVEDDDDDFDSIPQATIAGDPSSKKSKQKKKKKPYMFPHWCSYIAWILCFFSIITPAFFTILYSMEWGATKANEWLTTFVLSFFQSVIVVQPIKVLCLVAFIACVLKKPDLDDDGDCTDELNNAIAANDEELTNKGSDVLDEIARKRRLANEMFEPPDTAALETSRLARIKEMKMEEILKEICIYGFFALVLFFLSYQQRDKASYDFTTNMKNMFTGKFENIRTVLDYWAWLEGTFLPTLYVAKFHNGTNMTRWWDKRCIMDYQAYRMGIGRMRQFRIKEDSCKINEKMDTVINHCRNDYNWYDDDTQPYLPGWKKTSLENMTILDERRDDPFVYQNSYRLKNAPYLATLQTYKGGGYVINFERSFRRTKRNLTRLRTEDWLDLRTRAIILEFTVYNPNSNLFASAQMTTEFPSYGAAIPRTEFKVFRLQSYVGGFAIVIILFEVLYCCFTIFFFVRCIRKVKKEKCKYFKTFWDILEFVMLCFGVTCIAMYAFKHILTEVAFNSLHKQSKAEYVNFQSLALYDEMYGYMTAIVVFLASIQFLKLLQFNKKMNMLGDTVKLATKDLKVFSVAFLLYFFAFVVTGYLLFGQTMAGYNGLISSAESSFAFTLGAFDFDAMAGAQKFLGPLFFFAFIAVIYVGLMSIFLTIIGDAFTTVKENTQNAQNEYEMVDFIWRKFKGIIGVK